jgi:hypothetical protein
MEMAEPWKFVNIPIKKDVSSCLMLLKTFVSVSFKQHTKSATENAHYQSFTHFLIKLNNVFTGIFDAVRKTSRASRDPSVDA